MAYVCCALAMYLLWWNKPFNVERKTVISCPASLYNSKHWSLHRRVPASRYLPDLGYQRTIDILFPLKSLNRPGHRDAENNQLAFYGTGTVFSAIHLATWRKFFGGFCPLFRFLRVASVVEELSETSRVSLLGAAGNLSFDPASASFSLRVVPAIEPTELI